MINERFSECFFCHLRDEQSHHKFFVLPPLWDVVGESIVFFMHLFERHGIPEMRAKHKVLHSNQLLAPLRGYAHR